MGALKTGCAGLAAVGVVIGGGLTLVAVGFLAAPGAQMRASVPPGLSAPGTWSGTLTYQKQINTIESGGGNYSHTESLDEVNLGLSSTGGDGMWTITGDGKVFSTYLLKFESSQTSPVGRCDTRSTDDGRANDAVKVEGSLEVVEDWYQLSVMVPGIEGSVTASRDDTGCAGSRTTETYPWNVSAMYLGGDGQVLASDTIKYSKTEPLLDVDGKKVGETTLTFTLYYTP